MLEEDELIQKAHDDCLAHAQEVISGDLEIDLEEADLEWDPIQLRHVFDQPMVVWRRFGEFEVVLDDEDRPVGFIDAGGWKDCEWAPVAQDQALTLAGSSGWLSTALEPVRELTRGENGSAILEVIDLARPANRQRFTVEINPARMAIISILPQDYGTDG